MMNSETKEKSNIDDGTITQDSMEDVEVDFTLDNEDEENEDQQNKNGGRKLDERNERR